MDWLMAFYLGGVVATVGWLAFTLGVTRPFGWRGWCEVLVSVTLWPLAIPFLYVWFGWRDR